MHMPQDWMWRRILKSFFLVFRWTKQGLSISEWLDYLQQLLPKIQYPFVLWVALQVKGFIPIFSLLQQQDLKDNTLSK